MSKQFIAHRRKSNGKAQYLWKHLKEASELAGKLADKIGLKKSGKIIGLLHDLGKASKEFQNYIDSANGLIDPDEDNYVDAIAKKGRVDHSSAGAQLIYDNLCKHGPEGIIAGQILSLCVASHHSGMIDCLTPNGEDNFSRRMKKEEEKVHKKEVWSGLNITQQKNISNSFNKELINEIILALNKLKEENDSKESLTFKYGLVLRFLFSCLIDADRLSTSDFEFPKNKILRRRNANQSWNVLIRRFNAKQFECVNKISVLRNQVSKECLAFSRKPKGLYQLTVPTGGGKTLASLRFALNHAKHHEMDKIIYVIPYTSIIDQNAEEVRKILQKKSKHGGYLDEVVLEHHSNLTPEEETRRQNLLSENWDARVVFTTMVRFLETLFSSGTRSVRRMHQLANAVIIFDEVQTLPVRCIHLFNLAVRFLVHNCNSTVVLCTATQPLLDKVDPRQRALMIPPDHQMISNVRNLFRELKRVKVQDKRKVGGWTTSEVAQLASQEVKKSHSVLIIVNTKASAQNLYQDLRFLGPVGVYHLSTNMCPTHRIRVLENIKDRLQNKKPTICVSTQLIEAGVDIDFGAVIRYLAGLDSIAQAAGRCNRHGLRAQGSVFLVNPSDEDLTRLADIRTGKESAERVLDEYKENPRKFDEDILSPTSLEQYYNYYFYTRRERMNYPLNSKSPVGREDNLFDLLSTNPLSVQEYQRIYNTVPVIPLKQSFQSAHKAFRAIDSTALGIVVPYAKEGKQIISDLCACYELEKQYHLLKKAQRYSVNVFPQAFHDLQLKNAIHEAQEGTGVFYLDAQYYNEEFGLSKEIVNEMESYIA